MRIKVILLSVVALAISVVAFADIPVGEWRTHFSYSDVTLTEETPNKIFAVADGHLFAVSKSDSTITIFSKIDGLSDNSITRMAYDSTTGKLVLAYSNSNVDVIDADGNIHNVPDILEKSLSVDKSVNNITFNDGLAYLSTNFGIVVVNLKRYEIKDTYYIGDEGAMDAVYDVTLVGDTLYALMEETVKKAPLKGENLLDYNSWRSDALKLPNDNLFLYLTFFNGRFVIAEQNGDIYSSTDGENWVVIIGNFFKYDSYLHLSGENLIVGTGYHIANFAKDWSVTDLYERFSNDAVYVDGRYWIADGDGGLTVYDAKNSYKKSFCPDGPVIKQSRRLYYSDGRIVVAPGDAWLARNSITGAIMFYENDKWTSYTKKDVGDLAPDGLFTDVMSVAVDPLDRNHFFASTFGEGVYEFKDGKAIKLHNYYSTNGVLKPHDGLDESIWNHYTRVDGLIYDADGKLWAISSIGSSSTNIPVVAYMSADTVWHNASGYSPASTFEFSDKIVLHSNGQHWINSIRSNSGVLVKSDNTSKLFGSFIDKDGNTLNPSFFYDIVEDKNGTVWVGTDEGPILFPTPKNIFTSTYRVTRVKIPRDDGSGLADYLLDGIPVKCLAIDGGNRKWIGTTGSGLYLVSSDGLTQIHHFTTENSPLPSDNITALVVNPVNGSVFIGTDDGIVEYREGVTEPVKKFKQSDIYVFPNPVTPDYTGMITVTGLEENTVVKIVDASGHLVYEGQSSGGSLSWNGKNYHGTYVSGGVYFFHLMNTDVDNSRSAAAKVLIVR